MKYSVYGIFTGSKFLGCFEASSAEEAEELAAASEENSVCLCHKCSSEIELDEMSASSFHVENT